MALALPPEGGRTFRSFVKPSDSYLKTATRGEEEKDNEQGEEKKGEQKQNRSEPMIAGKTKSNKSNSCSQPNSAPRNQLPIHIHLLKPEKTERKRRKWKRRRKLRRNMRKKRKRRKASKTKTQNSRKANRSLNRLCFTQQARILAESGFYCDGDNVWNHKCRWGTSSTLFPGFCQWFQFQSFF